MNAKIGMGPAGNINICLHHHCSPRKTGEAWTDYVRVDCAGGDCPLLKGSPQTNGAVPRVPERTVRT